MPDYTTRTNCRVCGSPELTPLFSLGEQHVSDFVTADKVTAGPKVPIDIDLCRSCTLVQQRHTAPQDFLYTRHYWYRSGTTQTMRDALADVARAAQRVVDLKPGDVVLDIGSNDGTLLRSYRPGRGRKRVGIIRVGVEPAENLATEENYNGAILIKDFWHYKAFSDAWTETNGLKRAKIVTALGMFYDLEDPNQFIADVAKALHPEGVFVAQLMCLKQTLQQGDVGNFCHEHLEFYSLHAIGELFGLHDLEVFKIEENDVNGGSYRLYARHVGAAVGEAWHESTGIFYARERELGLADPATYAAFVRRLEENRDRCVNFIRAAFLAGKRVWVYGSSTKGNVILQYYGLGEAAVRAEVRPEGLVAVEDSRPLIEAAADRSPEKWGKYTIGTGIRITSEEEFRRAKPDYALVLPYSFRSEFLQREQAWRDQGGKFIFPLPSFEVV